MKVTVDGKPYEVAVAAGSIAVDGRTFRVQVEPQGDAYTVYVDGVPRRVQVPPGQGNPLTVHVDGRQHQVLLEGPPTTAGLWRPSPPPGPAVITAQMRGRVVAVRAAPGDAVAEGDLLLIIEAMKMENEVRSPKAGTVREVGVKASDLVAEGDMLVLVE
ncbi:MAG: biotin/lipoyl-containing protein [Dehalococcoidia bacterium]